MKLTKFLWLNEAVYSHGFVLWDWTKHRDTFTSQCRRRCVLYLVCIAFICISIISENGLWDYDPQTELQINFRLAKFTYRTTFKGSVLVRRRDASVMQHCCTALFSAIILKYQDRTWLRYRQHLQFRTPLHTFWVHVWIVPWSHSFIP